MARSRQHNPENPIDPRNPRLLRRYFQSEQVDFRGPCSGADTCWTVTNPALWNSLLEMAGLEGVQEPKRGTFLRAFADADPSQSAYVLPVLKVLAKLISAHPCVRRWVLNHQGSLLSASPRVVSSMLHRNYLDEIRLDAPGMSDKELAHAMKYVVASSNASTVELANVPLGVCWKYAVQLVEQDKNLKKLAITNVGVWPEDVGVLLNAFTSESVVESISFRRLFVRLHGARKVAELMLRNRNLRSVTLSEVELGDEAARVLASALEGGTSIAEMDLSNNRITSRGAAFIAHAVSTSQSLLSLSLVENKIGTSGGLEVAKMITVNTVLQNFDISYNLIGDNSLAKITEALASNTTLKSAAIRGNSVGTNGLRALAKLFATNRSISHLEATITSFNVPADVLQACALALADDKIRREMLLNVLGSGAILHVSECLLINDSITKLSLCTRSLHVHPICAAFENNTWLKELELRMVVGEAAAEALSAFFEKSESLKKFSLISRIASKPMCFILRGTAKSTSMTELAFPMAHMGKKSCEAVAGVISRNRTLGFVRLGCNKIPEAYLESIAEALIGNSVMQELTIHSNEGTPAYLTIRRCLRRNASCLCDAVSFAMAPSLQRKQAHAFEIFKGCTFFSDELSRAGMHPSSVVRRGENFISRNFFTLTGIVSSQIRCYRYWCKGRSAKSLGNISDDCIMAVTRFLRTDDVIDEE